MGICAQQHRIITGKYNSTFLCVKVSNKIANKYEICFKWMFDTSLRAVGLILYMYMLLLIMAIFIETSCNTKYSSLHTTKYSSKVRTHSDRELINGCFLTFLCFLLKKGIIYTLYKF